MSDSNETPDWSEIEDQFGIERVGVLDRAIADALSSYPSPIKREEFYLVSEHLTMSVLVALREHGVRFAGSVSPLSRRKCPTCKAIYRVTPNGRVRRHRRRDGEGGFCPTAGEAARCEHGREVAR